MGELKMRSEKNADIEMLRFLLTIAVCCHHFRMYSDALPFGGGYIAVDFFFIISGFFMAEHLFKRSGQDDFLLIFAYIKSRYMRLLPDYIAAFFIAFLVRLVIGKEILLTNVLGYIKEAFMIEIGCLPIRDRMNPPDWYVGYLLLASIIVFMLLKLSQMCGLWWSGLLSVFLYGILASRSEWINIYPQYASVIHIAIIRGIAGLLMGCFLRWIKKRLGERFVRKQRMARIFAFILLGIIFYILLWDNYFLPYIDYFTIILFSLLLIVLSMVKPIVTSIRLFKAAILMGEISYIMYLNHYAIASLFTRYGWLKGFDWKILSVCYLAVVIFVATVIFTLKNIVIYKKSGEC